MKTPTLRNCGEGWGTLKGYCNCEVQPYMAHLKVAAT
jgi:hypothetical protein